MEMIIALPEVDLPGARKIGWVGTTYRKVVTKKEASELAKEFEKMVPKPNISYLPRLVMALERRAAKLKYEIEGVKIPLLPPEMFDLKRINRPRIAKRKGRRKNKMYFGGKDGDVAGKEDDEWEVIYAEEDYSKTEKQSSQEIISKIEEEKPNIEPNTIRKKNEITQETQVLNENLSAEETLLQKLITKAKLLKGKLIIRQIFCQESIIVGIKVCQALQPAVDPKEPMLIMCDFNLVAFIKSILSTTFQFLPFHGIMDFYSISMANQVPALVHILPFTFCKYYYSTNIYHFSSILYIPPHPLSPSILYSPQYNTSLSLLSLSQSIVSMQFNPSPVYMYQSIQSIQPCKPMEWLTRYCLHGVYDDKSNTDRVYFGGGVHGEEMDYLMGGWVERGVDRVGGRVRVEITLRKGVGEWVEREGGEVGGIDGVVVGEGVSEKDRKEIESEAEYRYYRRVNGIEKSGSVETDTEAEEDINKRQTSTSDSKKLYYRICEASIVNWSNTARSRFRTAVLNIVGTTCYNKYILLYHSLKMFEVATAQITKNRVIKARVKEVAFITDSSNSKRSFEELAKFKKKIDCRICLAYIGAFENQICLKQFAQYKSILSGLKTSIIYLESHPNLTLATKAERWLTALLTLLGGTLHEPIYHLTTVLGLDQALTRSLTSLPPHPTSPLPPSSSSLFSQSQSEDGYSRTVTQPIGLVEEIEIGLIGEEELSRTVRCKSNTVWMGGRVGGPGEEEKVNSLGMRTVVRELVEKK